MFALVPAAGSGPSETKVQSRTHPFQSAIRPSRTGTTTTRTLLSMEEMDVLWPDGCRCWPNSPCSSSNVLFSRCLALHHASSSEPDSRKRAVPVIVVEILESALVFRSRRKLARDERVAAGGGEPSRWPPGFGARVGGRWDTQSWTKRDTRGLDKRWFVLRESGFVVIIIVG